MRAVRCLLLPGDSDGSAAPHHHVGLDPHVCRGVAVPSRYLEPHRCLGPPGLSSGQPSGEPDQASRTSRDLFSPWRWKGFIPPAGAPPTASCMSAAFRGERFSASVNAVTVCSASGRH